MKIRVLLSAALGFWVGAATAQTVPQPDAVPFINDAESVLIRALSLRDLGLRDGVTFRHLAGETTLYFPLAENVPIRQGRLTLNIRHGATSPVERFLQVSVGGRLATTQPLASKGGVVAVSVEINADDARDGFLAVNLAYSGAISEHVCIDERASGDFVQVLPTSGVSLELDRGAVATPRAFVAMRPSNMHVIPTGDTSLAGLAAMTRAAILFDAASGRVSFGAAPLQTATDTWETGAISLSVAPSGPASDMSVENQNQGPTLIVRGTDPQVGLWQLFSRWSGVADTNASVTRAVGVARPAANRLDFSALSADLSARHIVASGEFLIPFDVSDVPVGKAVAAVDVIIVAARDPDGRGATASVYLNDTLIGNRTLASGLPERLNFAVPSGLISRNNLIRVALQRQAVGGDCRFHPQGYPAQVLPGSGLELQDMAVQPDSFHALSQAFGAGVQVVVDPALNLAQADLMPWLGGVADTMIPDRATIIPRNTVAEIEPSTPFLVVSASNPGDTDPLITLDQGRIEIRDRDGTVMFDGEALSRLGIVQIVTRGGVSGLWLRPGADAPPELSQNEPLVLDRGNLALIDGRGVIVATSTSTSPLIQVAYPDRTSLMQVLAKYRPWIVGGVWILLTFIVLGVFQRLYRNRRAAPSSDS